jgi:hypothetical protein
MDFTAFRGQNLFFAHLEITFLLINILNLGQSIASLSSRTSPSSAQPSGQFSKKTLRVLSDTQGCLVSEFSMLKGNPPVSEDNKVGYRCSGGLLVAGCCLDCFSDAPMKHKSL